MEFSSPPVPDSTEEVVVLADGTSIPMLGVVQVPLAIQGYKETLSCVVIDLSDDYDIILGDAWLYDHAGIIDYCQRHIHLVSRGCKLTLRLPPDPPGGLPSPPGRGQSSCVHSFCSFWHALCAFRQGSPIRLVLVRRVGDLPEGDAPIRPAGHHQRRKTWLHALRE